MIKKTQVLSCQCVLFSGPAIDVYPFQNHDYSGLALQGDCIFIFFFFDSMFHTTLGLVEGSVVFFYSENHFSCGIWGVSFE